MNSNAFIFFGPSGSGKGTQAKLLVEHLEKIGRKTIYIETGQEIRKFIDSKTYTSLITKRVVDSGGLMPPFLPIWIWTDRLIKDFTGDEDLILDGLCRRPSEAPVLDSALKFYNIEKSIVIVLDLSRESAMERLLSRGRSDDSKEYIKSRLDWYERDVLPALEFFKDNPDYNWLQVSAERSIEDVHSEIVKKIDKHLYFRSKAN